MPKKGLEVKIGVMETTSSFNIDNLLEQVRTEFEQVKDGRIGQIGLSLADALMSGFALFSLKDPSLLAFDQRRQEPENMQRIYQIGQLPSDTQMRKILDEVSPEELRPVYQTMWQTVKKNGVLNQFHYLPEGYLLLLDGTNYFSSSKVHCENCLEKTLRNGETLYYHQMLGGVIASPEQKIVLPLFPEPIIRQDGQNKNDCERNAAKRFIEKLRQDHPDLPLVMVEDALSSNAPHIEILQQYNIRFILGVKESDHAHLFAQIAHAVATGTAQQFHGPGLKGSRGQYRWVTQIALNASHPNLLVNVLEYWETESNGKVTHWAWVTDLTLNKQSIYRIMRAGRARWKVENETFNTLKNQGYHFEHNFGHGQQYLSSLFATLMMLAFLVDQLQQMADPLFQKLAKKLVTKRHLWERVRALFFDLPFDKMSQLYQALLFGYRIKDIVVLLNTG